jgi:hypothetical protein
MGNNKVPSQSGRIHLNKSKERRIRAQERLRMATYRLRAFVWNGKTKTPLEAFAFVADFSDAGVGLFVGSKLKPLSFVEIAFEAEDSPPFNGKIAWCNRYTLEQHFLGHQTLSYRIGIQFVFASEPERKRYADYMQELQDRIRLMMDHSKIGA